MENFAIIIRLSVEPAIGTDLQPFFANVLLQPGTNFEGVWSSLIVVENRATGDTFYRPKVNSFSHFHVPFFYIFLTSKNYKSSL